MNEQERKIVGLLLNEMAFEGALKHFDEPPPDLAQEYLTNIQQIELPKRYDRLTGTYLAEDLKFPDDWSVFECCYRCLRIIRNNIVHANKAFKPDTPERLDDLLNWSAEFIEAVYATDTRFALRALEIKRTMKIESF